MIARDETEFLAGNPESQSRMVGWRHTTIIEQINDFPRFLIQNGRMETRRSRFGDDPFDSFLIQNGRMETQVIPISRMLQMRSF